MTNSLSANDGRFPTRQWFDRSISWLTESLTQEQKLSHYLEPLMQWLQPGWSSDSFRAAVLTLRHESDDVYSLVIRPHQRAFRQNWVGFQAGQHIELSAEKDGVRCTRTFSISSSPDYFTKTGLIELTIRVQEQGQLTPWFRDYFKQGGVANISDARGDFILSGADEQRPLLMIAGGSGITPFRSMLQQLKAGGSQRPVHLMYYARDAEQFLFLQEFQRLEKELDHFRLTLIDSSAAGFIQPEHLQQAGINPAESGLQIMICGPTAMIKAARQVVIAEGAYSDQVISEYFGAAPLEQLDVAQGEQLVSCLSSEQQFISRADHSQTLLDLAEQAAIKPVSGCRVGVCHQCICKKQSGVVYNTKTERYSDTGAEEIQLCISVAVTDLVLDL